MVFQMKGAKHKTTGYSHHLFDDCFFSPYNLSARGVPLRTYAQLLGARKGRIVATRTHAHRI